MRGPASRLQFRCIAEALSRQAEAGTCFRCQAPIGRPNSWLQQHQQPPQQAWRQCCRDLLGQGRAFSTAGSTSPQGAATLSQAATVALNSDGALGSQDAEEPAGGEAGRKQLFEAALSHVREHGWSQEALMAGARDLSLSPAAAAMAQRGGAELVEFHNKLCLTELSRRLAESHSVLRLLSTREKLKAGVRMRLEMNLPYIEQWAQAINLQAQLRNAPRAVRGLATLTDELWHAAGDDSADLRWYSRRAQLAGIYAMTELYMLTDYSPDYADTWDALDRRLKELEIIGEAAQQLRGLARRTLNNWLGQGQRQP